MAADAQMQGPPPPPVGPADVAAEQVVPQLIDALRVNANRAAMETNGAEVKDFAGACLALAQSIVTLDASRLSGGDLPGARAAAQPPPQMGGGTRPKLPPTRDANKDGRIG